MTMSETVPSVLPTGDMPEVTKYIANKPVSSEGMMLDPNIPMDARREAIDRFFGATSFMVGMIHAGPKHPFVIIDSRQEPKVDAPFLLVNGHNFSQQKLVLPNKELMVGTQHHTDIFDYAQGVSRNHFSMRYDTKSDRLHITDHTSTNGTLATGFEIQPDTEDENGNISANYTRMLEEELKGDALYVPPTEDAPYGKYEGHPVIGSRSKSMRNGIYGTQHSEQLVVDDTQIVVKNAVNYVMGRVRMFAANGAGQREILHAVESGVGEILAYDLPAVERLSSPHYEGRGMIPLSDYIKAGIGVCRHQAVMAALVMEKAIETGLLHGSVGVQRNVDYEANGAHAWAVFRDGANHAIIVDPAQEFVGTREETKGDPTRWRYYIPDKSD